MSEYSQDFEQDVEVRDDNAKDVEEQQDEGEEEEHHLRLSLEVYSIKDLQEGYQVYCKFMYKLLGNRKTTSVMVRKSQDNRIENAFQAQEFFMTKSALYSFLASTPLIIELWHSDKYSKDSLIGTVTIKMDQVLRAPIKKTGESVLRVFDTWTGIDNNGTVGQLRVLIYLEDLGVKQKGAVLGKNGNPEDYRAVLELEMWKRAEEAKWKASLKQKETEYIANLSQEWQETENKRELAFQKLCNDVTTLENKLRTKAIELNKREKTLVKLEETKKMKIDEVVRTLALKEEEVLAIRARFQEQAGKVAKESKTLDLQIEKAKQEVYQAEEALRVCKREQDLESVTKVKVEIEELMRKNLQYSKEIIAFGTQKEGLLRGCEATRDEFLRILYDFEEERRAWEVKEQEKLFSLQQEIERFKAETLALRASQEKKECVRCSVNLPLSQWPEEIENPEICRLREEIASLLNSGMYTDEDPIIQELGKQIKILQTV